MCGLVGIMSSNVFQKHKEALSTLLYLDTFRGRDSTGVAAIRANADTCVLKSTVPGYEFIEGNRLNEHLKYNDFCWIGHNRFGTVGKNIKSNAHPFMILDKDGTCLLVGAHNGTLKNKHVLPDHVQFGTDSEALFNSIAYKGLEETIKEVEGAWALTYYDHVVEELRFLRNDERPLFYAFEDDMKTIIWASERWMLSVACSRHGIKLYEDKIYEVEKDTLYRIPAPDKMNDKLELSVKGGLVGKTSTFFQGGTRAGFHGGTASTGTTQTPHQTAKEAAPQGGSSVTESKSGTKNSNDGQKQQSKSKNSSEKPSEDRGPGHLTGKVVPITEGKRYKGFGGRFLSRAELTSVLANGCAWCELEEIKPEDRYAWLDHDKPVCSKCLDGEHEDQKMIDAIFGHIPPAASIH